MNGASLDMRRARHAMTKIAQVKQYLAQDAQADQPLQPHPQGSPKLYGSYVKALPASIVQVGLGQALATLLAKAKGKQRDGNFLLYGHVQDWLCSGAEHSPYFTQSGAPDLLGAIIDGDEDAYIRGQAEAMAYLNWLKKFAVAQLKDEGRD
jgi:CRISPR-associated protein Cmr5